MYRIIHRPRQVLLFITNDFRSALRFVIKHMNYNKEKHVITYNLREIPLANLLALKNRMDKFVGKKQNIYGKDFLSTSSVRSKKKQGNSSYKNGVLIDHEDLSIKQFDTDW